jgi:hypothetical protein
MGTYATFKHLFPLSAGYSGCISIRSGRGSVGGEGGGRERGWGTLSRDQFDGTLRNVRGGTYSPWRLYRLHARFLFLFGRFPSGSLCAPFYWRLAQCTACDVARKTERLASIPDR